MNYGLRTRVAKKASKFVKNAQAIPPPGQPPMPGPGVPGAPPSDVPAAGPAVPPKPPGMPAVPPKPPMAPGAPGAPGQPKSKEEIEQDVERDIRTKKEQEQKLNDIDEKVSGMSDQIEGLTKTLNNLVNTLQKEVGETTDYEDKFEELKDKEDNEKPSSTDFGLDKDQSLIVSKEGHAMSEKQTLRNARKERLKKAEELDFEYGTPPNKKYKQQVPAPQITKLKSKPEDWGQYRLKASDMALDLNAAKDEWTVVNKHTDQEFFKIHPTAETKEVFATKGFADSIINDVNELGLLNAMGKYCAQLVPVTDDDAGAVPSDGLGRGPGRGLGPGKGLGLGKGPGKGLDRGELLKKKLLDKKSPMDGDAQPPVLEKKKPSILPVKDEIEEEAGRSAFTAQEDAPAGDAPVEEAPAEEAVAEEVPAAEAPTEEAAVEEAPAEAAADEVPTEEGEKSASVGYTRRFARAFRLALSAQQKNLADNPLKAAWFEVLSGLDVGEPEKLIESTFSRAAAEHFEVALAKTAEYMGLGDESFVELEAQIGDLNTSSPVTASENAADEQHTRAVALRARAHSASLPFTSVTASKDEHEARLFSALPKPKLHGIDKFSTQ